LLSGYMLNTLTGYFDYTFDQIVAIN